MAGKGDKRRPCKTGKEERELREKYAYGQMTFEEFKDKYKWLKAEGKIRRG